MSASTSGFDPVSLSTQPRFTALPPLALYVHVPWCVRKCPYCDFNSHEQREALPEDAYVTALLADLDAAAPGAQGRAVTTVFIGGGTPSLFSPAAIGRLLEGIHDRIGLAADAERHPAGPLADVRLGAGGSAGEQHGGDDGEKQRDPVTGTRDRTAKARRDHGWAIVWHEYPRELSRIPSPGSRQFSSPGSTPARGA